MLGIWLLIGLVISIIFSLIHKEDMKNFIIRLGFVELVNIIIWLIFYS